MVRVLQTGVHLSELVETRRRKAKVCHLLLDDLFIYALHIKNQLIWFHKMFVKEAPYLSVQKPENKVRNVFTTRLFRGQAASKQHGPLHCDLHDCQHHNPAQALVQCFSLYPTRGMSLFVTYSYCMCMCVHIHMWCICRYIGTLLNPDFLTILSLILVGTLTKSGFKEPLVGGSMWCLHVALGAKEFGFAR